MRIAHIGNTAGIASILSKEQQSDGHIADVFVFDAFTQEQFGGLRIDYRSYSFSKFMFHKKLKSYDIWHYHYPYGSLKEYLEKNQQNKILLKHYHGDDLRRATKKEHDFCLFSTPDLLKYAPNGEWLPNPIDLKEIECYRINNVNENSPPLIVHYPYYRNMQSYNDHYSNVLDKIEKENKGRIINISNVTHTAALEKISYCSATIGKILPEIGWFGKFELESMALGKPVIAYVSDELYKRYSPPIYRTTIDTFHNDLITLLNDESEMKRLSLEGLKYTEKHHDTRNVTQQIYKYYKSNGLNFF